MIEHTLTAVPSREIATLEDVLAADVLAREAASERVDGVFSVMLNGKRSNMITTDLTRRFSASFHFIVGA